MKNTYQWCGVLLYLVLLGALLGFDWIRLLQPQPILSVAGGVLILTAFQLKRGISRGEVLALARWNAFLSGLLATLFALLGVLTATPRGSVTSAVLAEQLIPLMYGSILYLLMVEAPRQEAKEDEAYQKQRMEYHGRWLLPETATPVLMGKGLTPREIHVALKLLEGSTNKEIGAQLYISEATVKKHIQNLYRKCGAEDRQGFIALYVQWLEEYRSGRGQT